MKSLLLIAGCAAVAAATYNEVGAQSGILSESSDAHPLAAYERMESRVEVRVEGRVGLESVDIVTNKPVAIDAVLRRISRDCNRELVGLGELTRMPLVTVKLVDTDLRDALRWMGGSVGLRITATTSEIRITEDLSPYPTRSELHERAYSGYLLALKDYPNSTLAPGAAWNRARIDESDATRALEAARAFDDFATKYPKSDLVPQALLRSGKLFGKANAWDEAAARFDTLAGVKAEHPYSIETRRLLADAHTRIAAASTNKIVARESARRALLVLDALDDYQETQDPEDRRERYIVRSRAHSLAGEPVHAMRCLDLAKEYSRYGDRDPELAELRAMALNEAGRYKDAVVAWLFHASLVTGEVRQASFVKAAKAGIDGGEYVATMAVAAAAKKEGFGDAVAPFNDAALIALNMEPERLDLFGDSDRIARGERLALRGLTAEAVDALRPVFARANALPDEQRLLLATVLAKALATEKEIDEAVLVLRTTVESLPRTSQRQSIYQLAATLLEEAGEIERAIAALEGRL